MSFCHLLQGGSQKTNLVTSVSKIIVPYKFPCRCHNCQSELRINFYDIFLSAWSDIQGPELSSISFQISSPLVHFSLSSDFQSLDWVAAGRQPLRPHMWLDRSHRASNYYCLQVQFVYKYNLLEVQFGKIEGIVAIVRHHRRCKARPLLCFQHCLQVQSVTSTIYYKYNLLQV